jgi:hypothetical protein
LELGERAIEGLELVDETVDMVKAGLTGEAWAASRL